MTNEELLLYIIIALVAFLIIELFAMELLKNTIINRRKKSKRKKLNEKESKIVSSKIIEAVRILSETKTGAIITIERRDSLQEYLDIGVELNCDITPEIFRAIFNKESITHDGAVIIKGGKILCCSTYYPMSQEKLDTALGSRHRASLQLATITDAFSVCVSEESGKISVAESGKIEKVESLETLRELVAEQL